MGLIDELLHDVLLEAAAKRPDLSEEKWSEIAKKTAVESFPKITEALWQSLQDIKEENLFHDRLELESFTKRNVFRWR